MYPGVVECNGKTFDSVYDFIREYKVVMGPAHLHMMFLNGRKAGDTVVLVLDQYTHFRGCSQTNKFTAVIKILIDL